MSPPEPLPFALHRLAAVTRAEADFIEALHASAPLWRGCAARLSATLGTAIRAELGEMTAVPADLAQRETGAGFFRALVDGGAAVVGFVAIDAALGQALAGAVLSGGAVAAFEPRPLLPVEEACLEVLLAHALSDTGGLWRPRPARPAEMVSLPGPLVGQVSLAVDVSRASGWVVVWADPSRLAEGVEAARARRSEAGLAPALGALGGLQREARLHLGSLAARRRELAALEPGDVLMPGAWAGLRHPVRGWLAVGNLVVAELTLDWTDGIRGTVARWARGEAAMGDPRAPRPTSSTAKTLEPMRASVADAREVLELVVGGRTLSLAEVLALAPGQVLALHERSDAAVDLVLDGRTIGRGELVEVEGRLGVRIVSIGNRG